ncbi:MAG: hypothetical protein JW910_18765 [Anaerolineae bacterium]|nr:hypothetical protein [Anaerolineae bacterium]
MALTLRPFETADDDLLPALASAAAPFDPVGMTDWVEQRRRFDATKYTRRHYLALDGGRARGYGAIEQQGGDPSRYRLFVVCAPEDLDTAGTQLYDQLLADLKTLNARVAWTREYRQDEALLAFFAARGFVQTALTWDLRLRVAEADPDRVRQGMDDIAASGVTIISYAQLCKRGPACDEAIHQLINAIRVEQSLTSTVPPLSLEHVQQWLAGPLMLPEACFVAQREDRGRLRAIGISAMARSEFHPRCLVQDFVGIRRAERQPELIAAFGAAVLAYARARGYETLVAYLPDERAALRAAYEGLGFRREFGYVSAEKAL